MDETKARLLAHELVLRALVRHVARDPSKFMAELLAAAQRELRDEGVSSPLPDDLREAAMVQVVRIAAELGWRAKLYGDLPPDDPAVPSP